MMQEHVAYWMDKLRQGAAIVFGPVADPASPWGLCVILLRNFRKDDTALS